MVETSGVAEGEDGGVVIHLDAPLFGIDVGDIGFVSDTPSLNCAVVMPESQWVGL